MNDLERPCRLEGTATAAAASGPRSRYARLTAVAPADARGGSGAGLLGLLVVLLLFGALGSGCMAALPAEPASRRRLPSSRPNFVPSVRVEKVTQRLGTLDVSLPATTLAFEAANIYARASGYVARSAMSISAITSRRGSFSQRSLHPRSRTRSLNIRIAFSRPSDAQPEPSAKEFGPGHLGTQTRCSSSEAG